MSLKVAFPCKNKATLLTFEVTHYIMNFFMLFIVCI